MSSERNTNVSLDLSGTTAAKVHRVVTTEFWKEFGKDGHKINRSSKPKAQTLSRLQDIGELIVLRQYTPTKDRVKRAKFDHVKVSRHKFETHSQCFACGRRATVRHHIVWIRNGGLNSKRNLISLCADCHAEIHPWLKV